MSRVQASRPRGDEAEQLARERTLQHYLDLRKQWLYAHGTRKAILARHIEGCLRCRAGNAILKPGLMCPKGNAVADRVADARAQLEKIDQLMTELPPPADPPAPAPLPETLF